MTGRPRRRAVRSAKLGFQVSAFQISEFHSRLSFVRSRCFRRGERSTRKAREPHTEARVEAPVPRAHSRRSRSARAIVELALSTLLLVHPLSAMSADEKNEAAAALPEGDGEFTPTLWSVTGPTETKRPEPGSGGDGNARAPHETDAAADEPAAAVPLSKNARKRLAKQEAWAAKKKARKEEEKALKQQKSDEARAAFAAKMEAMTDAGSAEYEAARKANREKRIKEAEEAKAKKTEALRSPYSVVLDLEFGDLMTEKESRSMAKQLTYCYSANTKAAVPLCLYFTGLDGEVGEALLKSSPGYKNWAVRHEEGSYLDALAERKGDLVYLTADSEHELTEFKPNEVYIIGGIVDKNRHKNLTLNKANEQGIRHARLPIRDHLKMTGTHILTVNQALDIVLAQLELKDWDKAMERAVPVRKQAKECTEEDRKKEGDAELSE